MSDVFFEELQQEFLTESAFMLEQYEEGMLALESGSAPEEVLSQIFRVAHSIKGGAAAVGFTELSQFAHVAEDLLALIRQKPELIRPSVVSLLLESGDVFRERIQALKAGDKSVWDVSDLKSRLEKELQSLQNGEPVVASVSSTTNEDFSNADWGLDEKTNSPTVDSEVVSSPSQDIDNTNHELLAELLAATGEAPPPPPPVETVKPVLKVVSEGPSPAVSSPSGAVANPAVSPGPTPSSPAGSSVKASPQTSSIKVDTGRVDSVLDAVGEIVVLKNQLVHDDLIKSGDHPRIAGIVDQLDKLVRELYDKTLSIRMTPLKSLFVKVQRLVRDVSMQLGKPVNLQLMGEETEVERTVFEILGDPLVHLVRNALDHGIEKPEIREANGKPKMATLVVSAKQVGGTVLIEIIDDGGGINREKVLKKAIEKNLIAPGRDPETLRDEEVFQFIFAPGFSTADKVSDLSGRGVGLDVVRSNLEKMQGKIDIISKPGQGSTFRLSIPLSTAITDGILVAAGQGQYILPIHSIREIVRVLPENYTVVPGKVLLSKFEID